MQIEEENKIVEETPLNNAHENEAPLLSARGRPKSEIQSSVVQDEINKKEQSRANWENFQTPMSLQQQEKESFNYDEQRSARFEAPERLKESPSHNSETPGGDNQFLIDEEEKESNKLFHQFDSNGEDKNQSESNCEELEMDPAGIDELYGQLHSQLQGVISTEEEKLEAPQIRVASMHSDDVSNSLITIFISSRRLHQKREGAQCRPRKSCHQAW